MIQAVHRALQILKCIAKEPDREHTLTEIAKHCDLHQATCANLLKTLLNCNYVEKHVRRRTYSLGPMPFWLTRDGPYRKDLVVRAQPVITRLARELQEWVIVATMNMGKRFIICRAEVNRPLITNTDYFFLEDAYSASTGRVLLAGLVPDELESYISSYGLPTDWDGVQTKGELYEKLEKIRNQGFATNTLADEVVQIAFPIQADLRVPAALGLAMPLSRFQGDNRTRVLMTMKAAAEEISGRPASSEPASGTTDEKELH